MESRSRGGEANTYSASRSQTSHCQYSQRKVAGPPSGSNWGKRKGCRSEDLHPFTALSAADSALSRNLTATDREALIEEHLEFVEGPAFQEHVPVGTHMLDGLTIGFIDSDADSDAVDA